MVGILINKTILNMIEILVSLHSKSPIV